MKYGAMIDDTKKYRYTLWRIWDYSKARVTFIMPNPSTADDVEDDQTIKRCISFAQRWGYGSLEVVNLFARRANKFEKLKDEVDPIGPENDEYILKAAGTSDKVVLAWGIKGTYLKRNKQVQSLLINRGVKLFAIDISRDGHPKHPLFLSADLEPIEFVY